MVRVSTDLFERLAALPAEDQRRAVAHFRTLLTDRERTRPPAPLDPVALAQRVGLEPDSWQLDVLRSQSPRILLNCSRQSGKSTVTALLAVHTAHFQKDALVLLLSPTLRQSGELFKKALEVHRALRSPIGVEAESALRLELANGSRIVSLPGKEHTVRGFSGVNLLAVDEAARVPDDLYLSVRPMLAVSGGRLLALSTPFGTRGWWYRAWHSEETWERYRIAATECPRISSEFLAEERQAMGQWWFDQEYMCKFLENHNQPFGAAELNAAFSEDVEWWDLDR